MGSLFRRLHLSNRSDGAKQVPLKQMAYRARLGLFILSFTVWMESCTPQWCSTLAHRLRDITYQCKVVGQRIKTLVLRLCGLRSSPSSILTALEHKMAELDQPQEGLKICDWCRMALHHKCDRKICFCNCEEGY
jgi:hypothetical protein